VSEAYEGLVGQVGYVSVPIPADGPGEVMVSVRGGTEAFAAWADEPIEKHARVVVVDERSARSVTVSRFP
jgi:membrane-bound ClpP family serine protease